MLKTKGYGVFHGKEELRMLLEHDVSFGNMDRVVDSSLRGMTIGKLEVVIDLHHVDGFQVWNMQSHRFSIIKKFDFFQLQPTNRNLGRSISM